VTLIDRFCTFLDASPSPWHAALTLRQALEAAGFTEVEEGEPAEAFTPGTKAFVQRGASVVAFVVGQKPALEAGVHMVAAHTDSPNLRIKPQPVIENHGYVRLGVDPYGGVLLATWSDRDLGLAGRVMVRGPQGPEARLVHVDKPLARIPNVAIHLNRTVNKEGLKLNQQKDLPAVIALSASTHDDPFRALLADASGVKPEEVLTWDVGLYCLQGAAVSGLGGEFLHSARLDNLASCHAALEALLATCDTPMEATRLAGFFDHEEVGSTSSRGAKSQLLQSVLRRLTYYAPDGVDRAMAHSWLISADMAHAVHPSQHAKHDPQHMPKIGEGPVIKQNVNQRYTTEADSAAMFVGLCEATQVPYQWFVNRSDLACGSTVGPMISADLGVRSIDVGNPMLSMHSAREMCGTADHGFMVKVLERFWRP